MIDQTVSLQDKYTLEQGRVYLTGLNALVRVLLTQHQRDAKAGLNTGGFVSGYRGSPLAGFDTELQRCESYLSQANIHFEPGLNEELAATSVWGSQQTDLFEDATVDGVFSMWYAKGPGVDRSVDALKHANMAGTSRYGGVLAIAGDDHGCRSSTLPNQSEQVFQAAMIPILNPSSVEEYLELGLYGIALSRYAGCWVGFKAIAETVETSASVRVDLNSPEIVLPADFTPPEEGLGIRWPDSPLEQEKRLHGPKMEAVAAFVRANNINRLVLDSKTPRLGIVTTGKAYLDVRQALEDLGIDDAKADELGIRVYKLGMSWPVEEVGARTFAEGLQEILVVEEKQGFIEDQLARILFNTGQQPRPVLTGKRSLEGEVQLGSTGELSPALVAGAIVRSLQRLGVADEALDQRFERLLSFQKQLNRPAAPIQRTPFFCSGCPHSTSTRLPEGSHAFGGIGCHGMATYMPHLNTETITQMGGEGTNWIGLARFRASPHVFQNLGDGTYTHSGSLAIRAAAAAGVNVTYKVLYNDAVAMTGGQAAEGGLTVRQIAHQMVNEGARKVVVVTDEPEKYPGARGFPSAVTVHHRDELDGVQRELRDTPGLTVLIYDQTCAAEKRRRRKKGEYPDPAQRVFINTAVCEGCGDCSAVSSCVSVKPRETAYGRKRVIDQSNCNKDFSCVKGFCPSFVSVRGGGLRKQAAQTPARTAEEPWANLPEPVLPGLDSPYGILVTGIGGTGVLTVGALIGMAAHLEGKGCSVLDFAGLAQKNGAVVSHIRIARQPDQLKAVRLSPGGARLVLGCDLVVTVGAEAMSVVDPEHTDIIVNSDLQPTAAFLGNPDLDFNLPDMFGRIREALGDRPFDVVDATELATALVGDSIATNLFMLGYAYQKGRVPVSQEAIMRAVELNGVAVDSNRRAFMWGRLAAADRQRVEQQLPSVSKEPATVSPDEMDLDAFIEERAGELEAYQNAAWADSYRDQVRAIRKAEQERVPGATGLTRAVAGNLYKLMAYKDEYEVARLFTDGRFQQELERQFEGDYQLEFHLAPPLLTRRDPNTGEARKKVYGPWVFGVFRVLARLRGLRGSVFDPFGYTRERREERQLIRDYQATLAELATELSEANHRVAVALARVPEQIRGYGHVKQRNLEKARAAEAALRERLRNEHKRIVDVVEVTV